MQRQTLRRILGWLGLILLVFISLAFVAIQGGYMPTPSFLMKQPAPTPIPAETRDERWQQTVEYLGSQLPELHINPYFKVSLSDFQKSVSQLSSEIPTLNDEQIIVRILQIIASIGDGHTRAYPDAEPLNYSSLPIEMRWVDDGLVVVKASDTYEETLGAKVVQIGDHEISEVDKAVRTLIAADNEMEILSSSPAYIAMPTLLYGLNLIPEKDRIDIKFESIEGSNVERELQPVADAGSLKSIYEKLDVPQPLYEKDRESFYWVQYLPDTNLVYVQYNVCAEEKDRPFEVFKEEVFGLIDGHPDARLVLDLRFNGGGNEAVLKPLIKAIQARPTLSVAGKVFVIIGRGTYSSALQNAITLKKDTNAILVGEPTGGKPNHYGEVRYFNLPNVGLLVQYSTRYWLNYPDSDPLTLEPDISAKLTMDALLHGRDPSLETITAYPMR